MYEIKKVIFICEDRDHKTHSFEVNVFLPNHTFSNIEMTKIVHRGILSCFEPPFYVDGENTIIEPNP